MVVDYLTILLNVRRSSTNNFPLVLDLMVAALGALYNNASSPNASPIV